MVGVLVLLAVFSVPLTAILSRTYLRAKEIDARGSQKLLAELDALRSETTQLRGRVEVLETIAVDASATLADAQQEQLENEKILEELQARSTRR